MDEKLIKYLSGELSQGEVNEVEGWLEDPENKKEFGKIKQLWDSSQALASAELFHADKNWMKMKQRMDTLRKKSGKEKNLQLFRYAIAASLIFLIGIAGFFYFQNNRTGKLVQYTAGSQKQEKPVQLPDGTLVYLNHNTNLSYNNDFNKNTRTVTLSGEAFFDVAKNASIPFIIRTASAEIKVVGTSFNVMAYAFSDSVQVLVQSGVVEMYSKIDKVSKVLLTVGNEGTYVKSDQKLVTRKSFDTNMLAWKTQKLDFRNADLPYVVGALEHAFGKKIQLQGGTLKNCRLTVDFNNQSLETIFKVIKETINITVINQGDVYIVSGPGC